MKHRLERVNEVIRRELSDLVNRELRFESKLVTIQQVDITPDLKHAHVYVSFIGTDAERRDDMNSLHAKRAVLQQALSKRIVLKYTPLLHFKVDEAVERGSRVLNIMGELDPLPPDQYEDSKEQPKE